MADVIRMPLLSDTMTEGKIATWNKKVGDSVKSDESLADVETDKATMEVIPYVDGTLLYIGVEAGKSAKVNDIIAIIGKPGEDISAYLNETPAEALVNASTESTKVTEKTNLPEVPADLTVIRMPLLSDTMTSGKIVLWNKQVGDTVKADDSLADVETDKATMEVVGYAEGTLLYRGLEAGESARVNDVIAVVGKAGTNIEPYIPLWKSGVESVQAAPQQTQTQTSAPEPQTMGSSQSDTGGRVKASPLARSLARERGIDLTQVQGSGDNGRIIKRDIDQWQSKPAQAGATIAPLMAAVQGQEGFTDIPLTQMRQVIARRLSESKFSAPHFYLKTSIQMDKLMDLRKQINAGSAVKISVNDMIIKASAAALRKHPEVNSSWLGEVVRQHHHIHIGSALALPEGLIVPVVRFADQKTLSQIASEASSLYEKARNKKLQPAEFSGNTFTISNLGMMDIDEFTAIINPPDACILAVGKSMATPVAENGQVVIRQIMKLTLSCDHRVVDGAVGAQFLQTLKSYLENPVTMLI